MPEKYFRNPEFLGPELRWFVPGPTYVIAKLPHSIFDYIPAIHGVDAKVVTLMMPTPLYVAKNMKLPEDNWSKTIQGIPVTRAMQFFPQLEAIRFNQGGIEWRIQVACAKLSDPLSNFRMVDVFFLLPQCRQVQTRMAGLVGGVTAVIESKHGR